MSAKRVVITGIGLVTPLGVDSASTWSNIVQGKSGIRRIQTFDPANFTCRIAGEVDRSGGQSSFNPEKFIDPREIRKMDLFIQYGIAAATEAIIDSGWMPEDQEEKDEG